MNRRQLLMGASLALFLASCAAPAPAAAPAAAKPNDLGGREVVIALENAYPPFNFMDEKTGEGVGLDYDMINDACKRLNCKTKFVTTSWDAIVAVMESERKAEWDMAADGVTITIERAQNVDFSDIVINVGQRLLVRKGESRFKTADEFKANAELIFGAQPGTTNYVIMEKIVGKDRIVAYDQFGLIVQALMNNDIDATVMDDVAILGNMKENPDKLEKLDEILAGESLGFVFPKYSQLRAPFNQALADQRADGTFDKLQEKWIP